jgi:hypothetical protein
MKQRLVMIYELGNGCSWSCEHVHPIVHESVEAAYCEFMDILEERRQAQAWHFIFRGIEFCTSERYDDLRIITVDEWFFENGQ